MVEAIAKGACEIDARESFFCCLFKSELRIGEILFNGKLFNRDIIFLCPEQREFLQTVKVTDEAFWKKICLPTDIDAVICCPYGLSLRSLFQPCNCRRAPAGHDETFFFFCALLLICDGNIRQYYHICIQILHLFMLY